LPQRIQLNVLVAKCSSCNGQSYSKNNISNCPWCDQVCHKKCINGILGCNKCCDATIPGFRVHTYELYGSISTYANDCIFNPYSSSNNAFQIGEKITNESEENSFWNEISDRLINCKYKQLKYVATPKHSELNVLSLNIRSLHKNISTINDNALEFQNYDILCFNETNCNLDKLANGIDDLNIEGFHPPIIQAPMRKSCRGGGLATYINRRVCSEDEFSKLDIVPETIVEGEFLLIKITNCKGSAKSVIIANVYRSPSRKPNQFHDSLDCILQKLNRHDKKHILLVGDFNIDLIKYETDINSQNIVDTASNYGFIQVISRPTRITDHSATLIDHIYTNKINSVLCCDVITLDLSDHLATSVKISLDVSLDNVQNPRNRKNDSENREYRMFNEANDESFKHLIANETWDFPIDVDAETKYKLFMDTYMRHYNTAYPLNKNRKRRKHERVQPKPWMTPWLEDACNRKNNLFHAFVKKPTTANKTTYIKMKKFVDKHIKKAKSKYYNKYFEQYKDNSKKQWNMINILLNRNTKKSGVSSLKDSNGNLINTPSAIADKFNEYFSNIALNLKSKISPNVTTPDSFRKYLTNPISNCMPIEPVVAIEISDIVKKLKNKSTLDTKICALKIAASDNTFNEVLAQVITASFTEGVFPQPLKLARVVPIHKGGNKSDVSNYRPISLLSSFSKIYEKLMHKRLVKFMNDNDSLYEMQYGFRSGRSCEHALLTAQNCLLNNLNKNKISLLLLIDFSKAFDMVDHTTLLCKLQHYGIRGKALDWFKSYLNNRKQFVSVNGKDSITCPINFGVPQGSILGPLLFVIYINDLPAISKLAKFILYADDANIILTGNTLNEIEEQLHELINVLLDWVDINGLLLNLKKTVYMLFSRNNIAANLTVKIRNVAIERKSETKFLGVIVDEKLLWTKHIKTVRSKMCRYVGIMYKIKTYLPLKARLQIFHSFVQSHINYCSLVWGFSAKSNIESIFVCQKKGLRAVVPGFVNYFYKDGKLPAHTKSSFNKFKILTIHNIIIKNTLIAMHKITNLPDMIPKSVGTTISPNAPTSGSNYETCEDWLNVYGSFVFRKSFFFKGPLIFSDPSTYVIETPVALRSIDGYKHSVKRFMLAAQGRGEADEWHHENFILYNIQGLRKSVRLQNNNL
jgi:exonuclease III